MCPRKQVRSGIPALELATYSTDAGKKLNLFVQKMDKKKKNDTCCKALSVNTKTHKFAKIFFFKKTVYSTGGISQLISRIT